MLAIASRSLPAEQRYAAETEELSVLFDASLERAAKDVIAVYAEVKSELETVLGWRLDVRPTIVLIKTEKDFQKSSGGQFIVAYAVPQRNLIVVDYSKMNTHPFTLRVTLKHELCHLLLHHHISDENLPRWLDEGIAQWVSDGISELIIEKKFLLDTVVLSERYIPLSALSRRFPQDRISLTLAYQQSKSLVEYMVSEFGESAVLRLLKELKNGVDPDTAIQNVFSLSPEELESRWHRYLKKHFTWFTYLSVHLYEILFFLAAVISVYGGIKLTLRKRRYRDEDEEDEEDDEENQDL
jgi:hypothetical protein